MKKMKRWAIYTMLPFLLCSCALLGPGGETVIELPKPPKAGELGANVRDFGAVGDAAYHHHFGQPEDEWSHQVGHYSLLVEDTFYAHYFGEAGASPAYTVISDEKAPGAGEVCVSEVARSKQKAYTPKEGDSVVAFRAADLERSVPATDDSEAFEAAIAAGNGCLYLPEGDYMISQLTAEKIENITGPGRIWLKEWKGGTTYYLASGTGDLLTYQEYGWIDEEHFLDEAWRSMHWVTCLPEVHGWQDSDDFSGNISPRSEFPFDENREHLNIWLTVKPAVEEWEFPDSVTICIGDMSVYYSSEGSREWHTAASGFSGGGIYHPSWSGENDELSESDWTDCGDWIEITLTKEALFRRSSSGKVGKWMLHCWSNNSKELSSKQVEYVFSTAQVWVKEREAAECVMCDIGSDMRTAWDNRDVKEGYIMEACDGGTRLVTEEPRTFYAYTVPDDQYDRYAPFPVI